MFTVKHKTSPPDVKTIIHDLRVTACYDLILSFVLSLYLLNFTQVALRHIKLLFPHLAHLAYPPNRNTSPLNRQEEQGVMYQGRGGMQN